MPTLTELEAELGLAAGTLTSKPDVATKWNGMLSDGETKLNEAKALQATIDDQIARFGITEATNNGLEAQVSMLKAAVETLKAKGVDVTDIKIPETPTVDADKQFRDNVVRGFQNVGQAMTVQNRYFQVFGKAMPDDPFKLADEAAAARMSISDFAEKKYGFAAEQQRQTEASQAARDKKIGEEAVQKYKEANPAPAFGEAGGLPSNYPAIPAPRDAKDLRTFSAMPARQKIADAMTRAVNAAKSAAA